MGLKMVLPKGQGIRKVCPMAVFDGSLRLTWGGGWQLRWHSRQAATQGGLISGLLKMARSSAAFKTSGYIEER